MQTLILVVIEYKTNFELPNLHKSIYTDVVHSLCIYNLYLVHTYTYIQTCRLLYSVLIFIFSFTQLLFLKKTVFNKNQLVLIELTSIFKFKFSLTIHPIQAFKSDNQ